MTSKDELLRRVTALEVATQRLLLVMGGIENVIQKAAQEPIPCSQCGLDPLTLEECEQADCPCGRYAG